MKSEKHPRNVFHEFKTQQLTCEGQMLSLFTKQVCFLYTFLGYLMASFTKKSLNFVFFRRKMKKEPDSAGKVNQNGLKVENTS